MHHYARERSEWLLLPAMPQSSKCLSFRVADVELEALQPASVWSLGAGDEASFIRDASRCSCKLASEFTGICVCKERNEL